MVSLTVLVPAAANGTDSRSADSRNEDAAQPTPTAEALRQVCGSFPTGVAVVTRLTPDGSPCGLTISSFVSVSLAPPLVLVSIQHGSCFLRDLRQGSHFAVNVLAAEQQSLSDRFALRGERERFQDIRWHAGLGGTPLLDDVLGVLEVAVDRHIEAGDHVLVLGRVVRADCREGQPLVHHRGRYRELA